MFRIRLITLNVRSSIQLLKPDFPILSDHLISTVPASLSLHIHHCTTLISTSHLTFQSHLLPLIDHKELVAQEHDLRLRTAVIWNHIHTWVLDGLRKLSINAQHHLELALFCASPGAVTEEKILTLPFDVWRDVCSLPDRSARLSSQMLKVGKDWETLFQIYSWYYHKASSATKENSSSVLGSVCAFLTRQPRLMSEADFTHFNNWGGQLIKELGEIHFLAGHVVTFTTALLRRCLPVQASPPTPLRHDLRLLHLRLEGLRSDIRPAQEAIARSEDFLLDLSDSGLGAGCEDVLVSSSQRPSYPTLL